VTDAFRNLLVREASKGTRSIRFAIVNPDRQFNQGADIGRYSEVLQHMLRGKNGEAPGKASQAPAHHHACLLPVSRSETQPLVISLPVVKNVEVS
jgi:hypothetical protein